MLEESLFRACVKIAQFSDKRLQIFLGLCATNYRQVYLGRVISLDERYYSDRTGDWEKMKGATKKKKKI